jgi:hypothetical protein
VGRHGSIEETATEQELPRNLHSRCMRTIGEKCPQVCRVSVAFLLCIDAGFRNSDRLFLSSSCQRPLLQKV